jgi:hypothetical protein
MHVSLALRHDPIIHSYESAAALYWVDIYAIAVSLFRNCVTIDLLHPQADIETSRHRDPCTSTHHCRSPLKQAEAWAVAERVASWSLLNNKKTSTDVIVESILSHIHDLSHPWSLTSMISHIHDRPISIRMSHNDDGNPSASGCGFHARGCRFESEKGVIFMREGVIAFCALVRPSADSLPAAAICLWIGLKL